MWLFTMFDLPVTGADTREAREARRRYTKFRKFLLKEGFMMLQFSVYARFCASEERSEAFRRRLRRAIPPAGEVRLLSVTDHQFGKMEVFVKKKQVPAEDPPQQLTLF